MSLAEQKCQACEGGIEPLTFEDIQKLAEQSNESARQIGEIITLLISDSGKAVDTMNEVMEIMEVQNKNIQQISLPLPLKSMNMKRRDGQERRPAYRSIIKIEKE